MGKHGRKHHSKDPRKLLLKGRDAPYDLTGYVDNILAKSRFKQGKAPLESNANILFTATMRHIWQRNQM